MSLLVVIILNLLFCYGVFCVRVRPISSDIDLSPIEIIENHGYIGETHHITTEDGYILEYHRILHSIENTDPGDKPAVLMMHGVSSSSADFVNMGPGRSLGFILADSGYDVWMANARGNAFSRNHTILDPVKDAEKFYNFTFHEIGYYDLANAIDYILHLNGDDSLYYVAHSQGTTAFLVLTSTRPEYNAKIKIASLMAPAAILKNHPSRFIRDVCNYLEQIEGVLKSWKIYEIPYVKEFRDEVRSICKDPNSNPVCDVIYNIKFGGNTEQVEKEFLPVIYTNNPSNTGIRQFIHYGQQVKNGGFSQFDYGTVRNRVVYGSSKPPPYNLTKISTPVACYYAKNDGIIALEDEKTLVNKLPNVVNNYLVPYESFNHEDFTFAKDIVKLVYKELMRVMAKY